MKKNLLLLFALIIGFASHAQKPQFGLKAGLNIANAALSGDGSPDGKSLAGFHVGLFTDFKLSSKFSFQPELLYSAQGTQFDYVVNYEGVNYDTSSKLKLNYITIPLMMKYYADPKFYVEFGPQIGFLTLADLEVTVIGVTSTQDFKDSMNSTDFGLNFGLGYDVSKKVVLSARYNQGLSNGFNTEPGDNSKLKNNVISFSLGYKFQ